MCGLIGIAGDTTGTWKDLYADLLLFDSVRGPHSTGAGFVSRGQEEFTVVKRVGHPFNVFHAPEFEEAMAPKNSSKVIIGHNRSATIGEKTEDNAHPFAFEHVLGMHNGTLDKSSIKELHDFDKFGTDSEAIFATINKIGIEETVKKLSGAWALVWFDRRNHTLNFLRNDKRPFAYCYSADRNTLIWASEAEMLKYVMERRHKPIEKSVVYNLTKDTLFSWKVPTSFNDKLDAPSQTKMEGRKWAYTYHAPFKDSADSKGTQTAGTTHKRGNISTSSMTKGSLGFSPIADYEKRFNSRKFRPPYKDQYNKVIGKKEFFPMVAEGCAFCNMNGQKWGEFIHILGKYVGYHTPYMCEDCFNAEDTYEFAQYAM